MSGVLYLVIARLEALSDRVWWAVRSCTLVQKACAMPIPQIGLGTGLFYQKLPLKKQ